MTKTTFRTLLLAALFLCVPAFAAATASDFYLGLLRRGTDAVDKGKYEESLTPLRLAAFGLVESVPLYQTAQAYLAIAHERLNQPDDARAAAQRVVAAERVERTFASLSIPDPIRASFDAITRRHLPAADVAILATGPSAPTSVTPAMQRPATAGAGSQKPRKETEAASEKPVTVKTAETKPVTVKTAETKPVPQAAPRKEPPPVKEPPVKEEPKVATRAPNVPREAAPVTTPSPKPVSAPPATKPATAAAPQKTPSKPAPAPTNVSAKLAAGERALAAANLAQARHIYRELLGEQNLDHQSWIRVAEGLYRSREFSGALQAFKNAGNLRPGEEPYRYYIAVALFETGNYTAAKSALSSALPFIEVTPDVERYRSRIESAGN